MSGTWSSIDEKLKEDSSNSQSIFFSIGEKSAVIVVVVTEKSFLSTQYT
jgi:hypothetical protein